MQGVEWTMGEAPAAEAGVSRAQHGQIEWVRSGQASGEAASKVPTATGDAAQVQRLTLMFPEGIDAHAWISATIPGVVVTEKAGPCSSDDLSDAPVETLYSPQLQAAAREAWMLVRALPSGRWGPGSTQVVLERQPPAGRAGCAWNAGR